MDNAHRFRYITPMINDANLKELQALYAKQSETARWRRGTDLLGKVTEEIHWFFLEPIPGVPFPQAGMRVPACRFVAGAEWINDDPTSPDGMPGVMCPGCFAAAVALIC